METRTTEFLHPSPRRAVEGSSQNPTSVVTQLYPVRNVFLLLDVQLLLEWLPSLQLEPGTKERIIGNELFMEKFILIFPSLVQHKAALQLSYHG